MRTNSNKRFLNEIIDKSATPPSRPSQPKRRRLNTKQKFANPEDNEQYLHILQAVDSTFFGSKLPHNINDKIAEYATGNIYECDDCKDKIVIFNQDFGDLTFWRNEYYGYGAVLNHKHEPVKVTSKTSCSEILIQDVWCLDCMEKTVRCEWPSCWVTLPRKYVALCPICNIRYCDNEDGQHSDVNECEACGWISCTKCHFTRYYSNLPECHCPDP